MIAVRFRKSTAKQLLSQLEDFKLENFSLEATRENLLRFAGAAYYMAKTDNLACDHCGCEAEVIRLVKHYFSAYFTLPNTVQVALDKTLSYIPKESLGAAIELYGHLFMLVDSGEYDQTYEENVVAMLLLGWHDWNCPGGSSTPGDDNFCGHYPDDRRVIFMQGLRKDEMASLPENDPSWFHYIPIC